MYAGGWITHSQLYAPKFRPIQRPVQVYRPPPAPVTLPAVPALQQTVVALPLAPTETMGSTEVLEQLSSALVSTPSGIGLSWLISTIIVVLVVMASVVYNIKQLQEVEYYKSAVTAAQDVLRNVDKKVATATRAVDPAELQCMSENIYFEAGGESMAGKMAVGQVVLNRVKNPNYPKTVCGVVHQKNGDTCQFSWLCEGTKEVKESHNWRQSQQVAYKLLSRDVEDITEGSTNFHGIHMDPKWNLKRTVKIDGHQFYK